MVSSSPIWYLRDETAFPDPDRFRPSRWLGRNNKDLATLQNEHYVPFSKGASSCVGIQYVTYLHVFSQARLFPSCPRPAS
jgi:cytochrome P450